MMEQTIKELQDTLVVVAEIQRRQAEVQKTQANELDALRTRQAEHERNMARVELNLAEATDKLNGLIG